MRITINKKIIILCMLFCILIYICAITISAVTYKESIETTRIFSRLNGNNNFLILMSKFFAIFSGICLIYLFPRIHIRFGIFKKTKIEYIWPKIFAVSMLVLISGFTLGKLFICNPNRIFFLFVEVILLFCGIIFIPRKSSLEININNAHGNLIHISILMLIFIMLILFNTGSVIFYKDVNCDYSESKALSIL